MQTKLKKSLRFLLSGTIALKALLAQSQAPERMRVLGSRLVVLTFLPLSPHIAQNDVAAHLRQLLGEYVSETVELEAAPKVKEGRSADGDAARVVRVAR